MTNKDMAMPTARAATASRRNLWRVSGIACIAIALAGCAQEESAIEAQRGVLRMRLNQFCLKNLPAGPKSTQYNDWDEVVEACSSTAYYQSNQCEDPSLCLAELDKAQGTSAGTAKTEGLGAQPAGPLATPCAQGDPHAPN